MVWQRLASFVIKFRFWLLIAIGSLTLVFGYTARKVRLSYDFVKAIPLNDPKLHQYQAFLKQYGEDADMMVLGIRSPRFWDLGFFSRYLQLANQIRRVPDVEDILSIPTAPDLIKDDSTHRLKAVTLFPQYLDSKRQLDSLKRIFLSLPFYRNLLYNPSRGSYLMGIHINRAVLDSSARTRVIGRLQVLAAQFSRQESLRVHLSGLPLIRTVITNKLSRELRIFLVLSILLTASILLLFFRSLNAVWMSLVVVSTGVVWSLATVVLLGYKLTILTGLIPPLIVVIGVPNCVYFLNKYHSEYARTGNQTDALVRMIQRMGIVTLFTNITAAIGFGVFFFTSSAVLKEFGVVAGINIMMVFLITILILPPILSYLPPPRPRHTSYLDNPAVRGLLRLLEDLVFRFRPLIYAIGAALILVAVTGMLRLNNVGYIVDDIPQKDLVYQDLKFFERNFRGVMPLEILVNTHHRDGITNLGFMEKLDSLSALIAGRPEFAKPLSFVDGIKFARQAYYDGDSASYRLPNGFDLLFLAPYLQNPGGHGRDSASAISRLMSSFMDPSRQEARLSVNMEDVGSRRLPQILDSLRPRVNALFPPSRYSVTFTGTSIMFLEGTRYIINGLKDSILLAFLLIICCMLYLFRSWRIVLISLIPNMIPLAVTAGVMGWVGVPIKPSTVLVFSIALGIAIDVTIRFLVNFKQELPSCGYDISLTVKKTIQETGMSIIYTGLILFAGFMIFSFSGFGGTQALGWLTSMTLVLAMLTNLTLLPALLLWMGKSLGRRVREHKLWENLEDEKDLNLEQLGLREPEET